MILGLHHAHVVFAEDAPLDLERLFQQLLGFRVLAALRQDVAQSSQRDRVIGVIAADGGAKDLDRLALVLLGRSEVIHPDGGHGETA